MVEFYYALRITASENNKQPNKLFNASKQSNFTIQIKCFGSQTSSCKKGESSYRLVKCVRFCSSSGIGPTAFKEYILLQ
jgi:hypothetical protein